MAIQVSYMGTKKQLAPHVSDVARNLKQGPLLDLFSGICAVGSELSKERQIWSNDVLLFPNLVAKVLFRVKDAVPDTEQLSKDLRPFYELNYKKLQKKFQKSLKEEADAIAQKSILSIREFNDNLPHVGNSKLLDKERSSLRKTPKRNPYRLFAIVFAGGYFGLQQSLQIDSIRYAIDTARQKKIITSDEEKWCLVALCQAVSKCTASPGHFAQYITPKQNNKSYYFKQRQIDVWKKWLEQFSTLSSIGDYTWRSKNKVFKGDALKLLDKLRKSTSKPAIIYADPPYTDDQYSRYYHLYDTLIKYDYPKSHGAGRYRPDRFRSQFSLKSEVDDAFKGLIEKSAQLGADLIISYPSAGCLSGSTRKILKLLKEHYTSAGIAQSLKHEHSTMGGSKGKPKNSVREIIFYAYKGKKK